MPVWLIIASFIRQQVSHKPGRQGVADGKVSGGQGEFAHPQVGDTLASRRQGRSKPLKSVMDGRWRRVTQGRSGHIHGAGCLPPVAATGEPGRRWATMLSMAAETA
jgi:hypothetical protein